MAARLRNDSDPGQAFGVLLQAFLTEQELSRNQFLARIREHDYPLTSSGLGRVLRGERVPNSGSWVEVAPEILQLSRHDVQLLWNTHASSLATKRLSPYSREEKTDMI